MEEKGILSGKKGSVRWKQREYGVERKGKKKVVRYGAIGGR